MNKVERKTNPVLKELIQDCEEAARKNDAPIWQDVAAALKKATRQQTAVNISHIERNCDDGDIVVVPGKVMGSGRLHTDVTVGALEFSASARESIADNGTVMYLEDLVQEHPDGSGLKLLR